MQNNNDRIPTAGENDVHPVERRAADRRGGKAGADIRSAAEELERQADRSLDMRPEFRRAIANVHTALATHPAKVHGAAPEGYSVMRKALERISQPANAGCGCDFPCHCDSEAAEAINAGAMRDIAAEALSAALASPVEPNLKNGFLYQEGLDIKAVLYTDAINDKQVCRDDLWLATTEALNELGKGPKVIEAAPVESSERAPTEGRPADLQSIEQYRLQMAAISMAAFGYWKEGDDIKPEYMTQPLRDVAALYAKYAKLHKSAESSERTPAEPHNKEGYTDGDHADLYRWLLHEANVRGHKNVFDAIVNSSAPAETAEGSIGNDPEFQALMTRAVGTQIEMAMSSSFGLRVEAVNAKTALIAYIDTLLAASEDGPAKPMGNLLSVKWAIRELLSALPERRDWLDPDAERELREFLTTQQKGE